MHFYFSVVASKKLWKKDADAENQQMCKCPDARIVLTMPSRITIMIFVPIRGNTHRGVLFYYGHERRRKHLILLRKRTQAEQTRIGASYFLRTRTKAWISVTESYCPIYGVIFINVLIDPIYKIPCIINSIA